MSRNNPLAKGMLKTERDGVIGSKIPVQARSDDSVWNAEAEAIWKEELIDRPCEVTGRFNFIKVLRELYLSYRRDGDAMVLFTDEGMQMVEGDQVGTPYGVKVDGNFYDVKNGIAYSKQTGRVVGYFIGKPNKWGFISTKDFQRFPAEAVHHVFNPDRFSFSRGEPVLAPSIDYIDKLCGYIDAELVAMKVNACFTMFISKKDDQGPPAPYTKGISSTGLDADNNRLEKMEPGTILYGDPNEDAKGIGSSRPAALFDPFVLRMLTLIGRPLCMPLMLITLDFSGATYMNARIAYQKCQGAWEDEQEVVVKPFVSRVWRMMIDQWIAKKLLSDRKDKYRHDVICNRWPYVDPFKEVKADQQALLNGTVTRTEICARQGRDFSDVIERLRFEEEELAKRELPSVIKPPPKVPAGTK